MDQIFETDKSRICKKCLMREMAETDIQMIEKYKAAIKISDRVDNALYEKRLVVCKGCDRLNAGTCSACGCYVELRALSPMSSCPYGLWEKAK